MDPASLIDATAIDPDLARLDDRIATLLNLEKSPKGFAAAAGLWFNPPVSVWYDSGAVTVREINERIVEMPCVYAAVDSLATGSRILDFGASESTLAYTLATLGHNVTALDSRGYPLEHPNLRVVDQLVEDWPGPEELFDMITAVSAVEHVGISYYDDETVVDDGGDRKLVERFAGWLKAEGSMLLTVPFGSWRVDRFMRTYDQAHLDDLLEGWTVTDIRFWFRHAPTLWLPIPPDRPAYGVAVVQAQPYKGSP